MLSATRTAIRRVAERYGAPPEPEPEIVLPDPVDWIREHFWIPETKGPIEIFDYQAAVIREALRTDENGKFVYDLVLYSDLKKSAKSTIAAAVVLYRAVHTRYGSFTIVANDLKQAMSRVFMYIERAIELNKDLQQHVILKNGKVSAQNKIVFKNRSVIEAVPIDPKGEAGGNADMVEFTELHAADGIAANKMWTELTLSPTKHGYSQRWIDTYAGFSGASPILEPLYQKLVKPENLIPGTLGIPGLEVYAHGRQFCLWNSTPRLPWQTNEYYASEADTLPPLEFDRVHGNKWGSAKSKFVPDQWWDACKVAAIPGLDKYREIIIALDAAISGDCFGVLALSRDGDRTIVRYARKWAPPKHGVIIYSDVNDPNNVEYPEGEVRRLIREFNVIAVGYDPHQLHHFCTSLEAENLAWFISFQQGEPRLKADKRLYDCIRDRRVLHMGESDLAEHVKNADSITENERMRIVKRSDILKIDLCVCLSMANELAYEHLPE